jgi:hypothetical protein
MLRAHVLEGAEMSAHRFALSLELAQEIPSRFARSLELAQQGITTVGEVAPRVGPVPLGLRHAAGERRLGHHVLARQLLDDLARARLATLLEPRGPAG